MSITGQSATVFTWCCVASAVFTSNFAKSQPLIESKRLSLFSESIKNLNIERLKTVTSIGELSVGSGVSIDDVEIQLEPNKTKFVCQYETPGKLFSVLQKDDSRKCPMLVWHDASKKFVGNIELLNRCVEKPKNPLEIFEASAKLFGYCPKYVNSKPAMKWAGFTEVLYYRRKGYHSTVCTAVRIGPQAALTAAHCVLDKDEYERWRLDVILPIPGKIDIVVLAMKPRDPNSLVSDNAFLGDVDLCLTDDLPSKCAALRSKVVEGGVVLLTKKIQNNLPISDMALIRLDSLKWPGKFARLSSLPIDADLAATHVTQIGWGVSETNPGPSRGSKPNLSGGQPEFSPKSLDKPAAESGWVLLEHAGISGTKSCASDSGSPVFSGEHNGSEVDRRELLGLVSAAYGPKGDDTASACKTLVSQGIQFITPQTKDEICKVAKDQELEVIGCTSH